MKTYNIELLYQLYKKNSGNYFAVEKECKASKRNDLPLKRQTIKKVADEYNFEDKLAQERTLEAEELKTKIEQEQKEFDNKLLNITKAGLLKYAQGLTNKKWISENGYGELFKIYMTLTGRPSVYTKNENDNFNAVAFIESITDDVPDDTEGVDHDGKENDQSNEAPEGLEVLASSGTKLRS